MYVALQWGGLTAKALTSSMGCVRKTSEVMKTWPILFKIVWLHNGPIHNVSRDSNGAILNYMLDMNSVAKFDI